MTERGARRFCGTMVLILLATLFYLLVFDVKAFGGTVRLQEGSQYGITSDGTLWEGNGSGFAASVTISIMDTTTSSRKRIVIKWDSLCQSIPAGATITAAVCSLRTNANSQSSTGSDAIYVTAYKVKEQWETDTTAGSLIEISGYNIPPWWSGYPARRKYRIAGTMTTISWTNLGCGFNTSADEVAASDSVSVPAETNTWFMWSISSTVIQGWLDNSTTNHGLMFKSREFGSGGRSPGRGFFSSNDATASNRPILRITYTTADGTTPKGKRRRLMQLGEMDTITTFCRYEEEIEK